MSTPVRYLLLVLAIPVAIAAYLITAQVLSGLALPSGLGDLLVIFLPLFVAGLCSIPFIAPFFDLKARQALADRPGGPGPGSAPPADRSPDEPRPPRA
jgi:hypothetical protein